MQSSRRQDQLWFVSMSSFLCRTVISNYLLHFVCTYNLRRKSFDLPNVSGSQAIVTESIIVFSLFTQWELILRLVFSDTERSDEQNSSHRFDQWTSEYSE